MEPTCVRYLILVMGMMALERWEVPVCGEYDYWGGI